MTLTDAFVCPKCSSNSITIVNTGTLLSDVRLDQFRCSACQTQWRMYSKATEITTEIVYMPPNSVEESDSNVSEVEG